MKFYHHEPPRYWSFVMNPTDAMLYNMARSISLALSGHELHNSEVTDQQAKDAIGLMRSFVLSAREMAGRPPTTESQLDGFTSVRTSFYNDVLADNRDLLNLLKHVIQRDKRMEDCELCEQAEILGNPIESADVHAMIEPNVQFKHMPKGTEA